MQSRRYRPFRVRTEAMSHETAWCSPNLPKQLVGAQADMHAPNHDMPLGIQKVLC